MEDRLPASVVIAGAGAIGVEFAYIMRNYGVDVTMVEFLDRILPLEDPEISAELAKEFKKLGIEIVDERPSRLHRRPGKWGRGQPHPLRRVAGDAASRARPASHRLPTARRRFWTGERRRRTQLAGRHRNQRENANQCPAYIRHWRCDRKADAGARGGDDGRRPPPKTSPARRP